MSASSVESHQRAFEVQVTGDELIVLPADGRLLAIPTAWFPRLLNASEPQCRHFELPGEGLGIHWPEMDEDLSIAGLLRGTGVPQK